MFLKTLSMSCLCCLLFSGCGGLFGLDEKPEKSIIGKKTQDIQKADEKDKQNASDSKIHASDPITAPLAAYGPMVEKISKIEIDHAINLFQATEGRYPKDYDEFMTRIIKENNIRLPELPYGGKYKYDEKTHELLIVRSPENKAKAEGK